MRPFFIGLSIALGFSISPAVMAQSADKNIQNLIANFKFSKTHIAELIDRLKQQGKVSHKEAANALENLKGITSEELQSLTMDSLGNVHGVHPFSHSLAFNDSSAGEGILERVLAERAPASMSDSVAIDRQRQRQDDDSNQDENQRQKLEDAQNRMLRTGFDIKKFQ